jgi:cyclic lactone autoinducer peptide
MKVENLIYQKILGTVNMLALLLVKQTANASCAWMFHQPEFPEGANKFKKVK